MLENNYPIENKGKIEAIDALIKELESSKTQHREVKDFNMKRIAGLKLRRQELTY